GLDDLEVDFLERRAFEQADVQLAPCPVAFGYAGTIGWDIDPATRVDPANCLCAAVERAPRPPRPAQPQAAPVGPLCVPHFNLGVHLPRTLESLAAQTYLRLDVLVIDDGSTDPRSRAVFQAMRKRYPRFRFLTQRNTGIG